MTFVFIKSRALRPSSNAVAACHHSWHLHPCPIAASVRQADVAVASGSKLAGRTCTHVDREGGSMQGRKRKATRVLIGAVSAVILTVMAAGAGLAETTVKPYVVPVSGDYQIKALFSVDDKVPLLGGTSGEQYRMVGIPDGLGAHPNDDGTSTLFMNHELGFNVLSEPVVGGPRDRGAFVSQWILDA